MTQVPVISTGDEGRRIVDTKWKVFVDKKLEEGVAKFTSLEEGQSTLLSKLAENTSATEEIKAKLETHMQNTASISKKMDEHLMRYDEFAQRVQSAVDAIQTVQAGVRAIGVFGGFVAWCGKGLRKVVVWIAPLFAFFAAVWAFAHGKSIDLWQTILGIFK
jgi:ABC-type transport system involved in cytochrome bd biosynthesis fused ATPase/permease subunit